jgi:crossover junction endodeoxyribonuclease RuvC
MTVYLGIDPGVNGALAFFDISVGKLDIFDMPCDVVKATKGTKRRVSEEGLASIIRPRRPLYALVERVSAAPVQGRKQGTTSMFSFGDGFGCIKGVLAGLGIAKGFIMPQRWKAFLGLIGTEKSASREKAKELFPAYAGEFVRKKDDGRAEAALISYYAAQESPV